MLLILLYRYVEHKYNNKKINFYINIITYKKELMRKVERNTNAECLTFITTLIYSE